jgi:hypothetical protein
MHRDIIGGVSPLKARASKSKAGKVGIKATNVKAQRKSGFTESGENVYNPKGVHNLESNTGNMRLTSSLADTLKSKDPGTKAAITGKTDFGKTGDFEKTDDLNPEREERTITEESEGKSGNEFADNCHDADGNRLEGKVYYSEIKGMDILCKWGGSGGSGSFDYDGKNKQTSKDQYRTRKDKNAKWGPWQDK